MAKKIILISLLLACIVLVVVAIMRPGHALNYNDFPKDLAQMLDKRTAELKSKGGTYIAGRIKMSDGASISGGQDVMINLYGGIDEPLWVYKGGWFMMDRPLSSDYAGSGRKIVLRAFGYEPIDAPIAILPGEVTYLKFVMHKIPSKDLASVEGIVTNDRNEPFNGAAVLLRFPFSNFGYRGDTGSTFPCMEMTTGQDGRYSFKGLSVADYSLVASASGNAYDLIKFTPSAGEKATRDLKLYQNRKILIDYVYQPDGNSNFTGENIQKGTIEWTNDNDNVGADFSQGKVVEHQDRDIEMEQVQNVLKFRIFYANGKENGFYDAGAVDFESVTEAAQTGYSGNPVTCVIGHTYVVRTYENNYAKFVVRNITGGE